MILPRIGMCFTNGYHIPKDVWSLPFNGSNVIDYDNHISCTYKDGSFMHFHKENYENVCHENVIIFLFKEGFSHTAQ